MAKSSGLVGLKAGPVVMIFSAEDWAAYQEACRTSPPPAAAMARPACAGSHNHTHVVDGVCVRCGTPYRGNRIVAEP